MISTTLNKFWHIISVLFSWRFEISAAKIEMIFNKHVERDLPEEHLNYKYTVQLGNYIIYNG